MCLSVFVGFFLSRAIIRKIMRDCSAFKANALNNDRAETNLKINVESLSRLHFKRLKNKKKKN